MCMACTNLARAICSRLNFSSYRLGNRASLVCMAMKSCLEVGVTTNMVVFLSKEPFDNSGHVNPRLSDLLPKDLRDQEK
ncbi:putative olfactory receptor [Roseibium sp. TrichSKD4]|nr:putative olfactory receptor [Roseibium sp. TrichSKD4]